MLHIRSQYADWVWMAGLQHLFVLKVVTVFPPCHQDDWVIPWIRPQHISKVYDEIYRPRPYIPRVTRRRGGCTINMRRLLLLSKVMRHMGRCNELHWIWQIGLFGRRVSYSCGMKVAGEFHMMTRTFRLFLIAVWNNGDEDHHGESSSGGKNGGNCHWQKDWLQLDPDWSERHRPSLLLAPRHFYSNPPILEPMKMDEMAHRLASSGYSFPHPVRMTMEGISVASVMRLGLHFGATARLPCPVRQLQNRTVRAFLVLPGGAYSFNKYRSSW